MRIVSASRVGPVPHRLASVMIKPFFFGKSLPKKRFRLHFDSDGRNQGLDVKNIGHFIPPRSTHSNGSHKLS
jgi:hypothetical protein